LQTYERTTRHLARQMSREVFEADSRGLDASRVAADWHKILWGNYLMHRTSRAESGDLLPYSRVIGGQTVYLNGITINGRGMRTAHYAPLGVGLVDMRAAAGQEWRLDRAVALADGVFLPFRPINTERSRP
jgi:hypothetical protein